MQFDYAPDYKYYQSDVTRVFPASGRFTPRQREFYEVYLRLYQALMTSIQVHERPIDAIAVAIKKMDAVRAAYHFTDEHIRTAATNFVDGFRRQTQATSLGHNVGLEVHEEPGLGLTSTEALQAGDVVTVEPGLYRQGYGGVRLEDIVLVTESGAENLTNYPYDLAP